MSELSHPSPAPKGPDCIALLLCSSFEWDLLCWGNSPLEEYPWKSRGAEALRRNCENAASTGQKILVVCDSHSDRALQEIPETSLLNFLHICFSRQGEAHDPAITRRHWVSYLEAKISPWESKSKAKTILLSLSSPVTQIYP